MLLLVIRLVTHMALLEESYTSVCLFVCLCHYKTPTSECCEDAIILFIFMGSYQGEVSGCGCWLFVLQLHFNDTSTALQQEFNRTTQKCHNYWVFFRYQFLYLHWLRESVSSICRIFVNVSNQDILYDFRHVLLLP